jgi:hypothetical protein
MEIEQYAFHSPVGHWRNKGRNSFKVNSNGIKWKQKTSYQNLWAIAEAVLRGKFIAMSVYVKQPEISNKWPNDAPQDLRKTRISQTQN